MKIIGLLAFALCISLSSFAQHGEEVEEDFEHHCKFEERSIIIGLALPYSTGVNTLGVNFRMYYNINEHICFGPEYSYFKNEEYEIVDFDFIVHYIFETPVIGIYPLLGANYTVEEDLEPAEPEIENGLGVVYGAGIHRNVSNFTFFAEYSRVDFGVDDQFFTAGIMYVFK